MDDFVITAYWIEQNCTIRGGWTAKQLALIGIPWPPVKGWKQRRVGKSISLEAKAKFEALGHHGRRPVKPLTLDEAHTAALERDRS